MNSITIAADDSPVLTPPPNPSKPTAGERHTALVWLAAGDTPPARLAAATAALKAEGWTTVTAYASLHAAGPVLRVVDGGGQATKRRARLALVPARPVLRLAAAS